MTRIRSQGVAVHNVDTAALMYLAAWVAAKLSLEGTARVVAHNMTARIATSMRPVEL